MMRYSGAWACLAAGMAACCLAMVGCGPAESSKDSATESLAGTNVELLVVGDPALAKAAAKWKGEWNARTGGRFEVREISEADLAAANRLTADAVVYPAYLLGALAERKLILPLAPEWLEKQEVAWPDVFELLRVREVAWGPDVYAVPFGSPQLVYLYRADLLAQSGRQPPRNWDEYQKLAEFFAARANLGPAAPPASSPWFGTIEPLGPGWAAMDLLARAAPYAKHRDHYSTLFNIETMEPLVDGPPFVRALKELVAAARTGPPEQVNYGPAEVRKAFREGRSAMALTWPAAEAPKSGGQQTAAVATGFAELPGSDDVYNSTDRAWEKRRADESRSVVVLGMAGRVGSVSAESPQREAAFELLAWLSGRELSPSVSTASPATTLYRRSHVAAPGRWVEQGTKSSAAEQYAQVVKQTLSRQEWLGGLNIPGRDRYVAALDEAVRQAVAGKQTPEESLRAAAETWRKITAALGIQSQRAAYQRSLGLEPETPFDRIRFAH
ncbi:MAG: ABC transporter substrate-binding protein [Pirellulales bacterium]